MIRAESPGPKRFVESVLKRINDGESVGIVCPEHGEEFSARWWQRALDRSYGFGVVDVTEAAAMSLCEAVAGNLGLDHQQNHWDLFREVEMLGSLCFVVDSRRCAENGYQMLEQHAREVNSLTPIDRSRLVVLLPSEAAHTDDGRWARMDWLGVVTRADTLSLVESRGMYDNVRAEMVSEIARWDLELAEILVDRWDFSAAGAVSIIEPLLAPMPECVSSVSLRWSLGNQSSHRVDARLFSGGYEQLWAGKVERHVALDDGRPLEDRIQQRMWLGQVRAIFPELERHRLMIAEHVHRSAANAGRPLEDYGLDEISVLEIPELRKCVKKNKIHLGANVLGRLDALYNARNALAHMDCVAPRDMNVLGL